MIRWTFYCILAATTGFLPAYAEERSEQTPPVGAENILRRGTFQNARLRFERDRVGHVAFIGGSITEMNGYRPMVMEILQGRFPETEFTFTDAGISSTCSTTGAFRLRRDVLAHGPVDLLFVEFAVNDDQDAGHAERESIRGLEGIVRQTRRHNPRADIVITYFVNPGMLATWQAGETPMPVRAHERVAEHYQVPSIFLGRQVAQNIAGGTLTWKQFGGTHPKPAGNRIAAGMIDQLMADAWRSASPPQPAPHALPEPLDANSYIRGRLLPNDRVTTTGGAVLDVPDWKALSGSFRSRFADRELLCLQGPSAECQLTFSGTALGAYVLAGPDAARLSVSIDGGPFHSRDLYHRFSKGLHYPRTVMFAADLPDGSHSATVRIDRQSKPDRQAARILNFVAN